MKTIALRFKEVPGVEIDADVDLDGRPLVAVWHESGQDTDHYTPEEAIRLGSALIQAGAAAREKRRPRGGS